MHRKKTIEHFIARHRFFFAFIIIIIVYHVVVVNRLNVWKLSEFAYSFYCVDYSYGFATKLLPGAMFHFLFGVHADQNTAAFFCIALLLLFFVGLSALLEKFILHMSVQFRASAFCLMLLFITGAYTFSIFSKLLGMIDVFWLLFSVLFFLFLDHNILRFFIPVLFFLCMLVHFSSVVFIIIIFSVILLYRISVSVSKREKQIYSLIFALSMTLTVFIFIFFVANETRNICSIEEFHQKLRNHGSTYYKYFDYAFFHLIEGKTFIPSYVSDVKPLVLKLINLIYYQMKMNYDLASTKQDYGVTIVFGGLLILSPVILVFSSFFYQRMRQKGSGARRFCSFLMLMQFPTVFILGLFFATSTDTTRYITYAFLNMFISLIVVLYYERDQCELFFEHMKPICKSLTAKIYLFAYAAITLMPC